LIYTIEDLRRIIAPLAEKYEIPAVYLFGSYARGDADDDSDVDVLIQREGSRIRGLMLGAFYEELEEGLNKGIDLVTEESLREEAELVRSPWFIRNVFRERVPIYERN
jgi:predicted nucleotidyltransferase